MKTLLKTLRLGTTLLDSLKHTTLTSNISLRNASKYQKCHNTPKYDMENPYKKEKVQCILCKLNITPDYKNIKLLSQFQSPYTGRIYGKHITKLCKHKQEQVELEIKKAQNAGLMGYYNKDPDFLRDAKLFDPENPLRPHRF